MATSPTARLCMVLVLCLLCLLQSVSQNFEPYLSDLGGTFCRYLAMKTKIHRKYLRDCPMPTCSWDDWKDALRENLKQNSHSNGSSSISVRGSSHSHSSLKVKKKKERVVVSYAHNGFGNQIWEHTIAFMIAESLQARLLIAIIPISLSPDGYTPPNTFAGMSTMERLLDDEFEYEMLPQNSSIRNLCEKETFFLSDRPRDWRDKNYSSTFNENLFNLITDPKPRCLKMLGYFQNYPLCADDVRRMWTPKMFANFTKRPGKDDISIYLRCMPRHYHFNDKSFYDAILSRTTFNKVWLFQAPECPTRLGDDPSKDGVVAAVVRLLTVKYNATRWPAHHDSSDDVAMLLSDLSALSLSNRLILPVSSWAFWAGLFSNAEEVHVNAPPHHHLMSNASHYIYHDDKHKMYYGCYLEDKNDIEYEVEYDAKTGLEKDKAPAQKAAMENPSRCKAVRNVRKFIENEKKVKQAGALASLPSSSSSSSSTNPGGATAATAGPEVGEEGGVEKVANLSGRSSGFFSNSSSSSSEDEIDGDISFLAQKMKELKDRLFGGGNNRL